MPISSIEFLRRILLCPARNKCAPVKTKAPKLRSLIPSLFEIVGLTKVLLTQQLVVIVYGMSFRVLAKIFAQATVG